MPETQPKLPLQAWTVVSLRPRGQHAPLRRAAKRFGAKFLSCSGIRLVADANDTALSNALACDTIIVTSPAAAKFAAQSRVFLVRTDSQWFALGHGTANALKKAGVSPVITPDTRHDSEGLLAIDQLQHLQHKSVALITAPGGRGLIEHTLVEKGIPLCVAYVYQREQVRLDGRHRKSLQQLSLPFAVICSSYEAFQSVWQQTDAPTHEKLKQGFWVLSSARLQGMLAQVGISNSSVSGTAKPEAMMAHLNHVQTQQVR